MTQGPTKCSVRKPRMHCQKMFTASPSSMPRGRGPRRNSRSASSRVPLPHSGRWPGPATGRRKPCRQSCPAVSMVARRRRCPRHTSISRRAPGSRCSTRGSCRSCPPAARREAERASRLRAWGAPGVRDLRSLLWSSIDNDDSRDLDQIEVAERAAATTTSACASASPTSTRWCTAARRSTTTLAQNTCTVYTGARIFPMLPESLSTDHTSLGEAVDRLAIVVEMDVDPAGVVSRSDVYRRGGAETTPSSRTTAWARGSKGRAPAPAKVAASAALQEQLRLQDVAAQALKKLRHERGALDLETIEARAVVRDGAVTGIELTKKSRARVAHRGLHDRRERCDGALPRRSRRGVDPARGEGAGALAAHRRARPRVAARRSRPSRARARSPTFLDERRLAAPDTFADLSLSVVKLMGPGEYALERPGEPHDGHFGLAVTDYTHSTAPNRRFADLVTQRLVKAVLAARDVPVHGRRARGHRRALHAEGERRAQGRADHAQAGRRGVPERPDRPGVRRHRDGRRRQGDLRAPAGAAGGGARRAAAKRGSTWAITCGCGSSRPSRARASSTSSGRRREDSLLLDVPRLARDEVADDGAPSPARAAPRCGRSTVWSAAVVRACWRSCSPHESTTKRLQPPRRLRHVAVEAPPHGAVAAPSRLACAEQSTERARVRLGNVVLDDDEHGPVLVLQVADELRHRPVQGRASCPPRRSRAGSGSGPRGSRRAPPRPRAARAGRRARVATSPQRRLPTASPPWKTSR